MYNYLPIILFYTFMIIGCIVSWKISKNCNEKARCFLTLLSWFGVSIMLIIWFFEEYFTNNKNS